MPAAVSLQFAPAKDISVWLSDRASYIDVGTPTEQDRQLLGVRIVKEGKFSHHDRRHFEVTLNTFLQISIAIELMLMMPPRFVTIPVPDADLMGSNNTVVVYLIGKESICLFSHGYGYLPSTIDPILLTVEEWKAIMKCYEENKGKFPPK